MEIVVPHSAFRNQRLVVRTAGWFSGPRLLLNGAPLSKKKGVYLVRADDGADMSIRLKNAFGDPVPVLTVGSEVVRLARPLSWYEYMWAAIPMVLLFIGGGLGAFVGLLTTYTNFRILRSDGGAVARFGLSGAASLGAFVLFFRSRDRTTGGLWSSQLTSNLAVDAACRSRGTVGCVIGLLAAALIHLLAPFPSLSSWRGAHRRWICRGSFYVEAVQKLRGPDIRAARFQPIRTACKRRSRGREGLQVQIPAGASAQHAQDPCRARNSPRLAGTSAKPLRLCSCVPE